MSTSFTDLLASVTKNDDGAYSVSIPEDWMQGRATYGGLTTALSLQSLSHAFPDLPPLRSAQIAFIGPAGGEVNIKPSLLRQGKSMSFIGADIEGEKGLATRCVFAFGAVRNSKFDERHISTPGIPGPDETPLLYSDGDQRPQFTEHFESRSIPESRPYIASDVAEHFYWIRHEDKNADSLVDLIALADMPPPAMVPKFDTFAPISSINWTFNLLTDDPQTEDRWWLVRSSAEHAQHGYSSQDMTVWNRKGEPVMVARQSVALFL